MNPNAVVLCTIVLSGVSLTGQSPAPPTTPQTTQTFHVEGTIYHYLGKRRTTLTYTNEKSHQTYVIAPDDRGFYEADLPLGAYSISLKESFRFRSFLTKAQPVFRVTSPRRLVLNINQRLAPRGETFLVNADDGTPSKYSRRNQSIRSLLQKTTQARS